MKKKKDDLWRAPMSEAATESFYRSLNTDTLRMIEAAFQIDRFAEQTSAESVRFIDGRLAIIARILAGRAH